MSGLNWFLIYIKPGNELTREDVYCFCRNAPGRVPTVNGIKD